MSNELNQMRGNGNAAANKNSAAIDAEIVLRPLMDSLDKTWVWHTALCGKEIGLSGRLVCVADWFVWQAGNWMLESGTLGFTLLIPGSTL